MSEDQNQQQEGRQLFCRVITPEKVIYDGEADLVVVSRDKDRLEARDRALLRRGDPLL